MGETVRNPAYKLCTRCGETKPASEFYRRPKTRTGLSCSCKKCERDRVFQFRRRNAKYVNDYLREHPCAECGENDWRVLDFDHDGADKMGNVADMANNSVSLKRIQAEIEKCIVRCANCHRRGQHRYFD